ncbi:hypothetical protein NDU88_004787 [Pleurodeles waltl]|uniref:Uncharacterized protein n=1 Tax=Pleurodeles waltl TaxID=8319 RepID=A0AAV7MEZ7_PLEWA|nr:hypothetical protein NDU88_004787 [Pleurodeles waltl]
MIKKGVNVNLYNKIWHEYTKKDKELQFPIDGTFDLAKLQYLQQCMMERKVRPAMFECLGRLLNPPPMPPVTLTNALIMRDIVTQQLMDIDISDNAPSSVNTVDYVNERNEAHYSNSRPIYEHVR